MTGIDAIAAERRRQIEEEGWTDEHDDEHVDGQLARAAACYADHAADDTERRLRHKRLPPAFWPWDTKWWNPKDRRQDLIKAGALIAAEIDRLDRMEPK